MNDCAIEMKWFGRSHGAAYEDDLRHASTPVGVPCQWCAELIRPDDDGLVVPGIDAWGFPFEATHHYECWMRTIVGGVNHQLKQCTCCGGAMEPDQQGVTRREAAKRAVRLHQLMTTEGLKKFIKDGET